jgi:hypothetical protein
MISYSRNLRYFLLDFLGLEKGGRNDAIGRVFASPMRVWFFDDARTLWLIAGAFLVLLGSMWLLLSPGIVYSNAMTWDLLFNLDGAWRLYSGQVLHVDFHHPLGTLPFATTTLGFQLVGIKPFAFVVGECVIAVVFTALAILAVKDRLPTFPGFLFVSLCILLTLVPTVVGSEVSQLTFAMSYNRYGWSAISILCLLLFIEPRGRRDPQWADLFVGTMVTFGLLYLKITYFATAVAAVGLALLTSRHIRRHWPSWCGLLFFVTFAALMPMNDEYRTDIIAALTSGAVHSNLGDLIRQLGRDSIEQIWVIAGIIILAYLAHQRHAARADVLSGLFVWISGLALLSQNAQATGIPLYVVVGLLLYVRLGDQLQPFAGRQLGWASCLMTCTLLPMLLPLFSYGTTLVFYNRKAEQSSQAFLVTSMHLQGLSVPADNDNVFDEVAADQYAPDTFSRIRAGRRVHELTQQEYVKTILGLADLMRGQGAASARVGVIDQVNPLPFVLAAAPPRGVDLWLSDAVWPPPEREFEDIDYVAIPRFPTLRSTLVEGLGIYAEYLSTRFAEWRETPYWKVLRRRDAPKHGETP